MSARVSIAGHPIHPMLVSIPIGLWIFSLVADLVFLRTGDSQWQSASFLTLAGGIVGALLAAVPGLFDLLGLEDQRARRIGAMHMGLNLLIVAAMAVNVWLRTRGTPASALPYVISAMAVVALLVSGWLGGHLVHVLGVTQPKDARVGHRAGEGSPRRAT
ncbi:MAG: DUF2231 domain-containing protein [Pseudomonadota bacterium]|jgi:Predicted membrane protein|nr:MAG: hypothetical protein DIU56_08770 [Pseudomonadota bacterium]